jgi:type I restriction-modification system DNA methylase subunit
MPRLTRVGGGLSPVARAEDARPLQGIEIQLWAAADALRGSMDAAEYNHVVLGLLFLTSISDAFEEQRARRRRTPSDRRSARCYSRSRAQAQEP